MRLCTYARGHSLGAPVVPVLGALETASGAYVGPWKKSQLCALRWHPSGVLEPNCACVRLLEVPFGGPRKKPYRCLISPKTLSVVPVRGYDAAPACALQRCPSGALEQTARCSEPVAPFGGPGIRVSIPKVAAYARGRTLGAWSLLTL